jgi:hypothetical protein
VHLCKLPIMAASMEGHWAQSEAIVTDEADTFIPYSKKPQAEIPTVSTAAPSSFAEDTEFPDREAHGCCHVLVGASSSGVAFPSPATVAPGTSLASAAPQGKLYLAGAAGAGVHFPGPFQAGSETRPCMGGHWLQSEAIVMEPATSEIPVVPMGGLAGAAGAGVTFPKPFEAVSAPCVNVFFSSIPGPSLAGCSSAGVSFPSPLASA